MVCVIPGYESLSDQVAALAQGAVRSASLVERALERADQQADLNAFVALDRATVLAQAEAATQRRLRGDVLSPIDGVPIAIKDNYLTLDFPTTACSKALPLEPSRADATIVANLRRAGAIIFGKTNMHEWAYGATNTTSRFGPTRNPHDKNRITGGSSGGSGAAVSAGIVGAALGSDTGGSIRIPSAACGIYGFKPSYGRASRHGVLPLSWSLDAPGPMARTLADIKLLLPYILGVDPNDLTTANARPFKPTSLAHTPKLLNLTGPGLERSDEVADAIAVALDRSGIEAQSVSLPSVDSYFAAWETILHCEASSYHAALLAKAPDAFSAVTRAHLEAGNKLLATELLIAQRLRGRFVQALVEDLPEWDALVLPTLPVVAPRHGEAWQHFGGRRVTTQDSMTWFCWIGNLAGLPSISIPVAVSDTGLPIGLMLMGRPGQDEALLAMAEWIDAHMAKEPA